MLSKRSAAFHLAEALFDYGTNITLAEQNLNNSKRPRRGEEERNSLINTAKSLPKER